MSEPDPSQNAQGLLLIYESVREEIIARIRMRRRLVGFSFAFTAAIIGYAFTGGSATVNESQKLPTDAWIVAVVPWVIGIVVFEILRSERILRKAGTHLQEIERVLINTPGTHGWETTSGGQSSESSDLSCIAASLLVAIYFISCLVGIGAWKTAPAPFASVPLYLLVIYYVVIPLPSIRVIYQIQNSNDDDNDDNNDNKSTTESTDQSLSEDRTHSPDIDKNDTRLPRV